MSFQARFEPDEAEDTESPSDKALKWWWWDPEDSSEEPQTHSQQARWPNFHQGSRRRIKGETTTAIQKGVTGAGSSDIRSSTVRMDLNNNIYSRRAYKMLWSLILVSIT